VPLVDPTDSDDWLPKDARWNDGALVSADVGSYQPNAWGLHDLHGNVAEWTRSEYRSYPYLDDDGRNRPDSSAPRVVRGGSWRDRPYRATASYRIAYRPYQPVFNVGFRVIVEDSEPRLARHQPPGQPAAETSRPD
jgi:formylglycine-generating enzyme required for sulfatase activity